jgi:hypothetical protein
LMPHPLASPGTRKDFSKSDVLVRSLVDHAVAGDHIGPAVVHREGLGVTESELQLVESKCLPVGIGPLQHLASHVLVGHVSGVACRLCSRTRPRSRDPRSYRRVRSCRRRRGSRRPRMLPQHPLAGRRVTPRVPSMSTRARPVWNSNSLPGVETTSEYLFLIWPRSSSTSTVVRVAIVHLF